ncbi:hypothetical protein BKA93DRAFT_719742, partial [Sparassis latifolia]
ISCVSLFWTRLVIVIGSHPTPLCKVSSYLTLSRTPPIDMYIVRHPQSLSSIDISEKSSVAEIMKLLLPHIGRWRKLRIVVDRAVSLPCPGLDLCGNAATLTRLQPESKLDQPTRRNTIDPLAENFQTPALNELITSGHIFRDAYLLSPKSLASITTLTISHYMVDSKPFFIHHLMHCLYRLQNLTNLELMYLDLDCSSEGRGLDDDQQLDIERMHFQGMHVSSLSSFYRAANY